MLHYNTKKERLNREAAEMTTEIVRARVFLLSYQARYELAKLGPMIDQLVA